MRCCSAYGPQHWWPARTPFEVILGAYLTQNTAWKAVERSLANLRAAGALTVDGLRKVPFAKLRRLIQPSGFFTRKAPALKAFVAMLDKEFGGSLETLAAQPTAALRQRLLDLPGVGPETADAILLYALGAAVPVADEYLRRVAARHHLLEPAPRRAKISYGQLTDLTRRAFAADPARESCATLQRIPRLDGGRGQGPLRAHAALRELSAGGRPKSSKQQTADSEDRVLMVVSRLLSAVCCELALWA